MAPIVEALEKELAGRVIVEFHDVSKEPSLAEKYQITTIPTQVFLDGDGKELFRHIGIFERDEIRAKMRELGMLKG
jgi:thioredoxin 1